MVEEGLSADAHVQQDITDGVRRHLTTACMQQHVCMHEVVCICGIVVAWCLLSLCTHKNDAILNVEHATKHSYHPLVEEASDDVKLAATLQMFPRLTSDNVSS